MAQVVFYIALSFFLFLSRLISLKKNLTNPIYYYIPILRVLLYFVCVCVMLMFVSSHKNKTSKIISRLTVQTVCLITKSGF